MIILRRQLFAIVALISIATVNTSAQKARKFDIEQWRDVLRVVQRELKDSYYCKTKRKSRTRKESRGLEKKVADLRT